MQHTNSQRGSDGRFSQSETPKAKRVEVWLQPQTVELLDTLTKQWGVGRGKVIDQLLTRGPVPPQSWSTVTEAPTPTPTPSAPPDDFEDFDFWSLPEEEQLAYFKQVLPEVTEKAKTMPHFEALRRDYVERLEQLEAKAKPSPTDFVASWGVAYQCL